MGRLITARQEFRELLQARFGTGLFSDEDALAVLVSKRGLKERLVVDACSPDGLTDDEFSPLFMMMNAKGIKLDPWEVEKIFAEEMPTEDQIAELIGPMLMAERWPEIIEEI